MHQCSSSDGGTRNAILNVNVNVNIIDVDIDIVFPVLWLTSCLAIIGRMAIWRRANRAYTQIESPGGSTGVDVTMSSSALSLFPGE